MTTLVLLGLLSLNPEEMLARALDQIKMCTFGEPEKKKLGDDHQELFEPAEIRKGQEEMSKKMTISLLLKPGRFQLEPPKRLNSFHGRETVVVNFSPRPISERPKLGRGEDRYVDRAMSELKGSIYIDSDTGKLISIAGELPRSYSMIGFYKKFIPGPLNVTEIKLDIQPETDWAWKPTQVILHFDGYGGSESLKLGRKHEKHTVPFHCVD